MRKNYKGQGGILPLPVLMIATYNEDGSVNVMNAIWGMMRDRDELLLNILDTHKTAQNIKDRKAFTVSIPSSSFVAEADYFGMVSGNNVSDKFERSGLTAMKSEFVDAPVINEFPICLECELVGFNEDGVVGKIVNTSIDENIIEGNKVVTENADAIVFDPYTGGYYRLGERVGEAFEEGSKFQ